MRKPVFCRASVASVFGPALRTLRQRVGWTVLVFGCLLLPVRDAFAFRATPSLTCYPGFQSSSIPTTYGLLSRTQANLRNPEVALIFWGSQWQGTGLPVSYGQMIGATQAVVNGPYFSALNQYFDGGQSIDSARMLPQAPVSFAAFPGGSFSPGNGFQTYSQTFTECDINQLINAEIANGDVPAPGVTGETKGAPRGSPHRRPGTHALCGLGDQLLSRQARSSGQGSCREADRPRRQRRLNRLRPTSVRRVRASPRNEPFKRGIRNETDDS
jgi:hypothetical protein